MKLKIHSLRIEQVRTYNNMEDELEDNVRYILNCISENNWKYEVLLWTEHGECSSGWCAASWGHCKVRRVDSFIGSTHSPIKELSFEIETEDGEWEDTIYDTKNEIFSVYNDGDSWYPIGEAKITGGLFKENNRSMEYRPVWIFKGDSALGKSYLAGIVANSDRMKTVYETDAHEKLDKTIEADIIVIGNKYGYSIEEIESRIQGEHEIIYVDFSKHL